ncbi:MAG: HAMP domain-containing histidine kinase [Anaerolineae bacterium]|nr:HAMP domain-containing histidine kinase [Anaerolineae bacterium]
MMLRTLRWRLILSHVLPLLVIVPIIGIALIYVLETRIVLATLAQELMSEANLIAKLARSDPNLWEDPPQAQAFVDDVSQNRTARVMLLDTEGRLLASSDSADVERLGQLLDLPNLNTALAGEISTRTTYSRRLHEEIADVLYPVKGEQQQVVGIIRLSHQLGSVQEQFFNLRYLIAGILIGGLLLGIMVGLLLALNMERPLRQVTQTIIQLTGGQHMTSLTEQGPEEIRQLLRAVNNLVERLRSLEQARRQLLANLVHELGRPLGALRAAVQAMLDGAVEDKTLATDFLTSMAGEIGRLRGLLDTLAQLHDQVLGTLELNRQPIDLNAWFPPILASWREAAHQKDLVWDVVIPPNLPSLEVDADRLAQALGNLLSNAIKYTPPGGAISISAGTKDTEIWIQVSDTGLGISPAEQAKIFTSFYRGQTSDRFPQGMGLGLTIAHDLIAAHQGRLEVESEPNQGSRFTIWLPLQGEVAAETATPKN